MTGELEKLNRKRTAQEVAQEIANEMTEPYQCYLRPTKATDEIAPLEAALQKAEGILHLMLVDPPSTLNEPDTDAEVLAKLRTIVREYFTENVPRRKGLTMPRKQPKPLFRRVLAEVMKAGGMFSIFDATENQTIAGTMSAIQKSGWVKSIEHGYPWLQWELTDEGRQQLDGFDLTSGKR